VEAPGRPPRRFDKHLEIFTNGGLKPATPWSTAQILIDSFTQIVSPTFLKEA
jgi:hypothetical protein